MSEQNDSEPGQIVTTRVGGGSSARIAVLVAAAVLGGVIWIGVTGRHDPPPQVASVPTDTQPAPSVTPTPSLAVTPASEPTGEPATEPPPRPVRAPTPAPEDLHGPIVFGDDAFAVIAFIDDRMFLEVLHEAEPGHLQGSFRLPFAEQRRGNTLELAQLWTRDESRPNFVQLGDWTLRLDALGPDHEPGAPLINKVIAPQPDAKHATRATVRGYRIVVDARTRGDYGVILVDVMLGSGT